MSDGGGIPIAGRPASAHRIDRGNHPLEKPTKTRPLQPAAFNQTESLVCDLQDRHEKADFFVDFCRRRHRFRNFLAQDVTVLPAQSVQRHP
jgi:hypothetical protein